MPAGYISIVLHAHLPFVKHPEYEDFLEERWFYEALTETYIPLLDSMGRLVRDGVPARVTVSLSPTLMSMMLDPLLQERYVRHLGKLIELAGKEVERTRWQPEFHHLALMYHERFVRARAIFEGECGRNLLHGFKHLESAGVLEVITCAATHGYLPLMQVCPETARAQILTAGQFFAKHFGHPPVGLWLPECGYFPGVDRFIAEAGIRYFVSDAHAVLHGVPRPCYGVYAPVYCPSGVAAFGRDLESSKQVWSAKEGYPGDFWYRDFYRDIGFDLDLDYVSPYIHMGHDRVFTGLKYYRITGPTDDKRPYEAERALAQADSHAGNFMFNREKQAEFLSGLMDRPPMIVSPYDAELFGHWWFEGIDWLELLLRKTAYDQQNVKTLTPGDYLGLYPSNQVVTPSESSWGWKGYHEVWLEGANDWIYRHLHEAARRMRELAEAYPNPDGLTQRALKQAARELFLAQASDWAFIMKTGTMVGYAVKRTEDHIRRFNRLYREIREMRVNEANLGDLEFRDGVFPDIDYRHFLAVPEPTAALGV